MKRYLRAIKRRTPWGKTPAAKKAPTKKAAAKKKAPKKKAAAKKHSPVTSDHAANAGDEQDLDLYWNSEFADVLENWGEAHVWREVQLIFWNSQGKVLDIACGTGRTMEILGRYDELELHGCDISDLLIERAKERGLSEDRLRVEDATNMRCYTDGEFNHSFSIGSLEHFTIEGIEKFIEESHRVTTDFSAHMIPISRSGEDEGWMTTVQSFHNNSEKWWRQKFEKVYPRVEFVPSGWEDDISIGVWIICSK